MSSTVTRVDVCFWHLADIAEHSMSALGVKRTLAAPCPMSAFDSKRTLATSCAVMHNSFIQRCLGYLPLERTYAVCHDDCRRFG